MWLLGPEAAGTFDGLAASRASGTRGFSDSGFFVLRSPVAVPFRRRRPRGLPGPRRARPQRLPLVRVARLRAARPDRLGRVRLHGLAGVAQPLSLDRVSQHDPRGRRGDQPVSLPSLALWSLRNDAVPFGVALRGRASAATLCRAAHTGYRRLQDPVTVSRTFRLDRAEARLVLEDRIAGAATHRVEFFFHAAPGGTGQASADGSVVVRWADGLEARIAPREGPACPGAASPDGSRRPTASESSGRRWVASVETPLPFETEWDLVAASPRPVELNFLVRQVAVSGGEVKVLDVPAPVVRPGGVLVRTQFSVISVGTESASTGGGGRESLLMKAIRNPALVRKVIDRVSSHGIQSTAELVRSRLSNDQATGYSCAGVVLEVGAGVAGLRGRRPGRVRGRGIREPRRGQLRPGEPRREGAGQASLSTRPRSRRSARSRCRA